MPDRQCSRGHRVKPVLGVCPVCKRIADDHQPPDAEPVVIDNIIEAKGDYYPRGEWE